MKRVDNIIDLLKKLQLKSINDKKLIVNAPIDYLNIFINENITFDTMIKEYKYQFIQIFGISNNELKLKSDEIMNHLEEDGLLWICYPKKTSKRYKDSECHRDSVASLLAEYNFEPVRQISIDDDFSAIRFRAVENIKKMNRKSAVTEEGKKRIDK